MLRRFNAILQHKCHIVASKPLLIGVSGGPDSLCLLDLLCALSYPVIVAHYHHRLRPEADAEARQVQELAAQLGVPFVTREGDVIDYAVSNSLSIEEAARELRYRFLFQEAEGLGAQAVAVGHQADDQVETVLMHLLRGAGLDGLVGMDYWSLPNPWSVHIPLVRPLLAFWRQEIQAYVDERGIHPSLDDSNLDTAYFRNQLRRQLIPSLERSQPQFRRLLWRTAEVLREDAAVLEDLAGAVWEAFVLSSGDGFLSLSVGLWQQQPVAMQRRLLRRAISCLRPGLRDVDFEAVERGRAYLQNPLQRGACDLSAGLMLQREGESVWLASWEAELPSLDWPQLSHTSPIVLSVPGAFAMNAGWALEAVLVDVAPGSEAQAFSNSDPFRAWLDADALPGPLQVRQRRGGDRIRPLGMSGRSMKVSDLMVNCKIPRRLRAAWPLVCAGDAVLWVPGCRQADTARLTTTTRRVIEMTLRMGTG